MTEPLTRLGASQKAQTSKSKFACQPFYLQDQGR
jgi:hypothetical protein